MTGTSKRYGLSIAGVTFVAALAVVIMVGVTGVTVADRSNARSDAISPPVDDAHSSVIAKTKVEGAQHASAGMNADAGSPTVWVCVGGLTVALPSRPAAARISRALFRRRSAGFTLTAGCRTCPEVAVLLPDQSDTWMLRTDAVQMAVLNGTARVVQDTVQPVARFRLVDLAATAEATCDFQLLPRIAGELWAGHEHLIDQPIRSKSEPDGNTLAMLTL